MWSSARVVVVLAIVLLPAAGRADERAAVQARLERALWEFERQ